ncbi:FHA domain-containing protein [Diaminobutyricimonas sp. LJ205]|uniref:FHA domain-containing protein n=1 Tax=Diaminobutyricimonas sp. LJ205 TaxID=2683590 RepID=UPI0012F4D3A9|nr:FHA domain-containing protein [Diaminobutyricimonas sp. LJ205]
MTLYFTPDRGWMASSTDTRLLAMSPTEASMWDVTAAAFGAEGIQAVLDGLLRGGISAAPAFALLDWADPAGLRVVLRGDAQVMVASPEGDRLLTGVGVATWAEQLFPGAQTFTLTVPGGSWSTLVPVAITTAEPAPVTPAPVTSALATSGIPAAPAPTVDPEATIIPGTAAETGDPEGYDYLFGATVVRSVSDAAIRSAEDDPDAAEAAPAARAGDHDGETVMSGDISELLRGRKRQAAVESTPVAPEPVPVLELPSGARERIDPVIIVGRAPSVSQVSGGVLPRLITLSGDQDVSRSHVRVALEGGTVVVTDLHSRNGTSIQLPGKPLQRLREGEPTAVIADTKIDLGGGVTLTVRDADA